MDSGVPNFLHPSRTNTWIEQEQNTGVQKKVTRH